ncbi:PQQ-binding-like beta-propeller repeat protein [Rhodopirellula sp. MGV]|uniref:PQQ-binding-like beta-propeller repeat protein n=1 Tax=Rhodopirellula sp. MGV TaxID=2023130 RepID=UPI000B97691E|nr:PQQ-binding-like beta-propeller repeat protein [Rhodopirellula sp. MGV]OYP37466.1 hypothetical protein CGZ80_04880 [Rhodopirellula sp. MGV]PNY37869.1 hypothetical protein C2E31_05020 [Rhodopirellula baltica]
MNHLRSLLGIVSWVGLLGIVAGLTIVLTARQTDRNDRSPELPLAAAENVDPSDAIHTDVDSSPPSTAVPDWPQRYGANRRATIDWSLGDPQLEVHGPRIFWEANVGTGYGSPVTSQGNVIQLHRVEDSEVLTCYDALSGQIRWEYRYATTFRCQFDYSSGPSGSPVIDGNYVYVVGGQHQVFCLGLTDGKLCWQRDLGAEYSLDDLDFAVGACPLIVDQMLIYNLGAEIKQAGIVALDCATGETIWTATDHSAGYCSPIAANIHGQPFVFVMTNRGLVSLDPLSGIVDWELEHHPHSDLSYNSVSPTVVDDLVLAITGPGPGALCVRVNADRSYSVNWKDRRVLDSQFNTLITHGNDVIGFTAKRQGGSRLRCIDIRSGDLRWESDCDLGRGQGLRFNSTLLLTGENGHLATIKLGADGPTKTVVTDTPVLDSPLYTSPAVFDRFIYVKNEHRLVCFEIIP